MDDCDFIRGALRLQALAGPNSDRATVGTSATGDTSSSLPYSDHLQKGSVARQRKLLARGIGAARASAEIGEFNDFATEKGLSFVL